MHTATLKQSTATSNDPPHTQIIIMYSYRALVNALSAHMIHINLNMIFYPHVEHSRTETIYIKYFVEKRTRTHTHTHTEHIHTVFRLRTAVSVNTCVVSINRVSVWKTLRKRRKFYGRVTVARKTPLKTRRHPHAPQHETPSETQQQRQQQQQQLQPPILPPFPPSAVPHTTTETELVISPLGSLCVKKLLPTDAAILKIGWMWVFACTVRERVVVYLAGSVRSVCLGAVLGHAWWFTLEETGLKCVSGCSVRACVMVYTGRNQIEDGLWLLC